MSTSNDSKTPDTRLVPASSVASPALMPWEREPWQVYGHVTMPADRIDLSSPNGRPAA